MNIISNADLSSLLEELYFLKRLRRQGWIRAGVPISEVETVAEHSFGVAILAVVLCPLENKYRKKANQPELNSELVLRFAICHDLAESKYQDLDTSLASLIGKEKFSDFKQNAEDTAFLQIQQELSRSLGVQAELPNLFEDSPEIQFVQDLDKLDIILQATNYIQRGLAPKGVQQLLEEVLTTLKEPNSFVAKWFLKEWIPDMAR
ncbi:MAG: HD domain-containing protein [Candidatus Hodarchaeales archaeon]